MPPPSVAIVIPCYGHAHVLGGAIESAIRQSVRVTEIIVVDDGSDDDPGAVVRNYPDVRLIKQGNQGLPAARNAGLRAASSDRVIFLDADDRLLPSAASVGIECFAAQPDAAFVYGGFQDVRGDEISERCILVRTHADLVRCNWIAMIAAVMFDRLKLVGVGGFDETLGMCEDWDLYLRLSRTYPFATHSRLVAQYHRQDGNMSSEVPELMRWVEIVRNREKGRGLDEEGLAAWTEGAAVWASFYPDPPTLGQRLRSRIGSLAGYQKPA